MHSSIFSVNAYYIRNILLQCTKWLEFTIGFLNKNDDKFQNKNL
jgi:hypothetical protein